MQIIVLIIVKLVLAIHLAQHVNRIIFYLKVNVTIVQTENILINRIICVLIVKVNAKHAVIILLVFLANWIIFSKISNVIRIVLMVLIKMTANKNARTVWGNVKHVKTNLLVCLVLNLLCLARILTNSVICANLFIRKLNS